MSHHEQPAADQAQLPVLPLYLVTDRSQSMSPLADGYPDFIWEFRNRYVHRPQIATRIRLTTVGFADEYRIGSDFEDMTDEWPEKYPFNVRGSTKSYREGLWGLMHGLTWAEEGVRLDSLPVLEPLAFFVTCEGPVEDSMADVVLPDYDLGEGVVYKRPASDTWANVLERFRARQSWRPQVACFFFDGDQTNRHDGQARAMMTDLAGPCFYAYHDPDQLFADLSASLTSSVETSLARGSTTLVPPPAADRG